MKQDNGSHQNHKAGKKPLHHRLQAVRDIFNGRADVTSVQDYSKRISFAEGGCLLPPHPHVLQAMQSAAKDIGRYTYQIYPQQTVLPDFIAAIQDYFAERCQIPQTEKTGTIIGFGSSHIFDCVLGAVCGPDDMILAPEGYYHSYSEFPVKWGARMDSVATKAENGFKLQADELAQALDSQQKKGTPVKMLVITNPTTTGAIYTQNELEDLARVIKAYDLTVYADEVFRDSEFPGQTVTSLATIPGMADHVITATSGSKTHGTADLRIGWACGPAAIIDDAVNLMEHSVTEIPLYLQAIGKAIIETPQSYLDEARAEYEVRARRVANNVERVNRNLNQHFGTQDISYLEIPYKPQSGHYLSLNMNALQGFVTPAGKILDSNPDLCRYLYSPDGEYGDPSQGVVFSSGYSKGHDDFTVYIAFAQLGFDKVINACQPHIDKALAGTASDEMDERARSYNAQNIPGLPAAYQSGRDMIDESFRRIEKAIGRLSAPACAPRLDPRSCRRGGVDHRANR